MDLTMIDLFSGIGGFSLAASWLGGIQTVQFVECDLFCQKILRKHWPTVPIHNDIRTFRPEPGAADIIVGGFPCQDISVAGGRAGIKRGTRSGLFFELMRVVRLVGPRYIVLENVAAITLRGMDVVLRALAEAGFDAEWACIPASAVGACHKRERWWCVAYSSSRSSDDREPMQPAQSTGASVESGGNSGANAANAYGQRQQERHSATVTALPRQPCWGDAPRSLSPNWREYLSKPVIYRGDDGLSGKLDEIGRLINESSDSEALSEADQLGREVLRKLWSRLQPLAMSHHLRGISDRDSSPVALYGASRPEEDKGQWAEIRQQAHQGLRDFWEGLSGESFQERQNMLRELSERAGAIERLQASTLKGRVNRLKALGNAVVPQVAAIPLMRVLQLSKESAQ